MLVPWQTYAHEKYDWTRRHHTMEVKIICSGLILNSICSKNKGREASLEMWVAKVVQQPSTTEKEYVALLFILSGDYILNDL